MIDISPADAVIIVGVVQGVFGLAAPNKWLSWQSFNAPTLTVAGVFIAFAGLALKVVLG